MSAVPPSLSQFGSPLGSLGSSFPTSNAQLLNPLDQARIQAQYYSPGGTAAITGNYGLQQAQTTGQYGLQSAQAQANAQIKAAQAAAAAQEAAAQSAADASKYGSTQAAEASKYGATQQYNLGMNQLGYKRDVFGQLMPVYTDALKNLGGGSNSTPGPVALPQGAVTDFHALGAAAPGGAGSGQTYAAMMQAANTPLTTQAPTLPNAPNLPTYQLPQYTAPTLIDPQSGSVVSRDMVNQQINNARAQNDQMTATAIQTNRNQMGGRGVGANSPLGKAITAQLMGANIGADAQAALLAQNNASQLNAAYAQAMNPALLQNASSVYGSQAGATQGAYGNLVQGLTGMYGTQVGGLTNLYGTQAGTKEAMNAARLQALQGAYSTEQTTGASRYGAQQQALASMYGTNLGYQGQIGASQIAANASQRNAILNAMAGLATA